MLYIGPAGEDLPEVLKRKYAKEAYYYEQEIKY